MPNDQLNLGFMSVIRLFVLFVRISMFKFRETLGNIDILSVANKYDTYYMGR